MKWGESSAPLSCALSPDSGSRHAICRHSHHCPRDCIAHSTAQATPVTFNVCVLPKEALSGSWHWHGHSSERAGARYPVGMRDPVTATGFVVEVIGMLDGICTKSEGIDSKITRAALSTE